MSTAQPRDCPPLPVHISSFPSQAANAAASAPPRHNPSLPPPAAPGVGAPQPGVCPWLSPHGCCAPTPGQQLQELHLAAHRTACLALETPAGPPACRWRSPALALGCSGGGARRLHERPLPVGPAAEGVSVTGRVPAVCCGAWMQGPGFGRGKRGLGGGSGRRGGGRPGEAKRSHAWVWHAVQTQSWATRSASRAHGAGAGTGTGTGMLALALARAPLLSPCVPGPRRRQLREEGS